jgi:hypothetical protein
VTVQSVATTQDATRQLGRHRRTTACRRSSDEHFVAVPMQLARDIAHAWAIMRRSWGNMNSWPGLWLGAANAMAGPTREAWMRDRQNDAFMHRTRKRTADFWLASSGARKKRS